MTSYLRGKKVDTCLLENSFWFTKFLTACKASEQCKHFRITTKQSLCDNHYDVHIQNNGSKNLRVVTEHHGVTFAENDADAYAMLRTP